VAGSPADLEVVNIIVQKLEMVSTVEQRVTQVFQLFNAQAADVATTLNATFPPILNVYKTGTADTPRNDILPTVIVVAEPVTNKLIVTVAPDVYPEVVRLIREIDTQPPQVVIQCMIAELDLTGTEEFGVEIGLQSPVMFQRSIFGNSGTTLGVTNPI